VNRGDICWYTLTASDKKRPVLVLTRDSAIPVLNSVTVAPITSTIRSIPTEVVLTEEDGLPATCAANFDNLQTIPKRSIGDRIARLSAMRMKEAEAAIAFALGFDAG
jgi:mRNA interferase MazF